MDVSRLSVSLVDPDRNHEQLGVVVVTRFLDDFTRRKETE